MVLDEGRLTTEAATLRQRDGEARQSRGTCCDLPLLTAILGALVRPLACVDSSMPCQTGRLERALCWKPSHDSHSQGWSAESWTYIGKRLPTTLVGALVRLLARVRAVVDCQRTLLDEALATVFHRALVRPLVCVDAVVSLEIRFPVEALRRPYLAADFPPPRYQRGDERGRERGWRSTLSHPVQ